MSCLNRGTDADWVKHCRLQITENTLLPDVMLHSYTEHLQHLCTGDTGFQVVYALKQLYMYSKNSMITIDTAAIRTAERLSLWGP